MSAKTRKTGLARKILEKIYFYSVLSRLKQLLGRETKTKERQEIKKYVKSELDRISEVHDLSSRAEKERVNEISRKITRKIGEKKRSKGKRSARTGF